MEAASGSVGAAFDRHGNGAPSGRVGSKVRAFIGRFSPSAITSAGVLIRRPVVSSLTVDESVGKTCESEVIVAVRRMDRSATFGFFTNIRRSGLQ